MSPEDNHLLRALEPVARQEIVKRSQALELVTRRQLIEPDEQADYVYFLTSGFASVVIQLANGGSAEVAIIGREGVVGGLELLGPALTPASIFIQMSAEAYRLPFAEMKRLFSENAAIRSRVLEFVQAQSLTMGQFAACNKLHEAESRLARWLLMVQDRIGGDTFQITQEFLAEMLGTQRSTVVMAAGALQRSGIITYSRGKLSILSREQLGDAACDCYPVAKKLYEGLYK